MGRYARNRTSRRGPRRPCAGDRAPTNHDRRKRTQESDPKEGTHRIRCKRLARGTARRNNRSASSRWFTVKISRREYVLTAATLSGLAEGLREEDGYDLEEMRDVPEQNALWGSGDVTPQSMASSGYGPAARWSVDDRQLDDVTLNVHYDGITVNLDLEGKSESARAGYLATLDPDQAKEIAVALYRAAEDVEEGGR